MAAFKHASTLRFAMKTAVSSRLISTSSTKAFQSAKSSSKLLQGIESNLSNRFATMTNRQKVSFLRTSTAVVSLLSGSTKCSPLAIALASDASCCESLDEDDEGTLYIAKMYGFVGGG